MNADFWFWVVDFGLLGVIIWQGERLLRVEQAREARELERYEERKQWRLAKQKQQLKKSEISSSGAKSTESPPPNTTPLENPKVGGAEPVDDTKTSSPQV